MELVVYPGADADYILYDDAGDGYGYETGDFRESKYHWDDASQTLTPRAFDLVVRVVR